MIDLRHGDCLELMQALPDASIDCIATDPPYYRLKLSEAWDRQWGTAGEYLDWLGLCLAEFARLLKPNGSLYLFASPQMAARVQMKVGEHFHVLNEIVWVKVAGTHKRQCPERSRRYHPQTERVVFAEQHGQAGDFALTEDGLRGDAYEPLRLWLKQEFNRAGWKADDLNRICGTASMAGRHYTARSQWALPTEAHYRALQAVAPPGILRRDYECLRREYEHLRREYEHLRRPFRLTCSAGMTDVWTFDTVQYRAGKHPCEKPTALLEHMLRASVRPGGTVFDPFAGSGTTGVAAARLRLNFLGMEKDATYVNIARARIEAENTLFTH